eukprot:1072187-Amphidinium_carterae.1
MDQGSDGFSAYWWMIKEHLNISLWADPSHCAWNDLKGSLKDVGLFGFWMMQMVVHNVPHGPWNDDARHQQLLEAWQEALASGNGDDNALFQRLLPDIQDELKTKVHFDNHDMSKEVWDYICEERPFQRKGCKSNLNRFFSTTHNARESLHLWTLRFFQYSFCGLELDMLKNPADATLNLKDTDDTANMGESKTTDSTQPTIVDKAMQRKAGNAMTVSIGILADKTNLMQTRAICTVSEPLEKWHFRQNKLLRAASSTIPWLLEQQGGAFMGSLCETLRLLQDPGPLRFCGLALPSKKVVVPNMGEVFWQDEIASLMADFALSLCSNRLQRCLWLLEGWPWEATPTLFGRPSSQMLRTSRSWKQWGVEVQQYKLS